MKTGYEVRSNYGDTNFVLDVDAKTFAMRQSELLQGPFRVIRLFDDRVLLTYTNGNGVPVANPKA